MDVALSLFVCVRPTSPACLVKAVRHSDDYRSEFLTKNSFPFLTVNAPLRFGLLAAYASLTDEMSKGVV